MSFSLADLFDKHGFESGRFFLDYSKLEEIRCVLNRHLEPFKIYAEVNDDFPSGHNTSRASLFTNVAGFREDVPVEIEVVLNDGKQVQVLRFSKEYWYLLSEKLPEANQALDKALEEVGELYPGSRRDC